MADPIPTPEEDQEARRLLYAIEHRQLAGAESVSLILQAFEAIRQQEREKVKEEIETLTEQLIAVVSQKRAAEAERDSWKAQAERKDAELRAVAHIERERDAAREDAEALDAALREVIDLQGVGHEDGCPEDDTCDCSLVSIVNAALAYMVRETLAAHEALKAGKGEKSPEK